MATVILFESLPMIQCVLLMWLLSGTRRIMSRDFWGSELLARDWSPEKLVGPPEASSDIAVEPHQVHQHPYNLLQDGFL